MAEIKVFGYTDKLSVKPGDKIDFQDFTLRFLVDEDLENYLEIQNWIRGLGFPESRQEIFDFQQSNPELKQPHNSTMNLYSDGTLSILTSKENPNFKVKFSDIAKEVIPEGKKIIKDKPDEDPFKTEYDNETLKPKRKKKFNRFKSNRKNGAF